MAGESPEDLADLVAAVPFLPARGGGGMTTEIDPLATLSAIEALVAQARAALDDEAKGSFSAAIEGIADRAGDLCYLVRTW